MASAIGLTVDDFERLPHVLARNHELVNGELVEVSGNSGKHNELRDRITARLLHFLEEHRLGKVISEQEYDFDGNVHAPDIGFFALKKVRLYDPNLRVQRFVPDLAVEIVSQNDRFSSLLSKAQRYLQSGVSEVWILSLDPRQVIRFTSQERVFLENTEDFAPSMIPGFRLKIGNLLANL